MTGGHVKKISRILLLLGIACCSFGTYAETKASARGNDLKFLSLEEFKNLDSKERGEYMGKLIRLRIVMEFVQNRMIMEATGEEPFTASNWDLHRMQFLDLLMRASTSESQAGLGGQVAERVKPVAHQGGVAIDTGTLMRNMGDIGEDALKWAKGLVESGEANSARFRAAAADGRRTADELKTAEAERRRLESLGNAQTGRNSINEKKFQDASQLVTELQQKLEQSQQAKNAALTAITSNLGSKQLAKDFLSAHDALNESTKNLEKATKELSIARDKYMKSNQAQRQNFLEDYEKRQTEYTSAAQAFRETTNAYNVAVNRIKPVVVKQAKASGANNVVAQLENLGESAGKEVEAAQMVAKEMKTATAEAKQAPAAAPVAATKPTVGKSGATKTVVLAGGVGAAAIGGTMVVADKVNGAKSPNANGAAVAPAAPAAGGAPAGVVGAAAPAAPATAEKPDAKANSLNDGDDCLYGGQTGKMKGGKCNRPAKTKCSPPKNGFQCGNYGIAQLNSPNGRLCVQLHPLKNLTARCTSAVLDAIKNLPNSSHVEGFNKLTTELESLSTRLKSYCAAKLVDDVHSGCQALTSLVGELNAAKNASAAKPADKAKVEKGNQ